VAEPQLAKEALPLSGLRILAIDDQDDARDALEAVLSAYGAQVQVAASGDDALAALSPLNVRQWPHALLCDIVLEDEDGYQVLDRIRAFEAKREIPDVARLNAIALTGHTQTEDVERSLRAGFVAHLTKPIAAPALIDSIRDVSAKSLV
jgi:ATP-binding cassette, subfamily B, bacterial